MRKPAARMRYTPLTDIVKYEGPLRSSDFLGDKNIEIVGVGSPGLGTGCFREGHPNPCATAQSPTSLATPIPIPCRTPPLCPPLKLPPDYLDRKIRQDAKGDALADVVYGFHLFSPLSPQPRRHGLLVCPQPAPCISGRILQQLERTAKVFPLADLRIDPRQTFTDKEFI